MFCFVFFSLAELYLSRVRGEEEHDGEARQQAGVLDGKGEEEAAAARLLFFPTHLVHLRELRNTKHSLSPDKPIYSGISFIHFVLDCNFFNFVFEVLLVR